VHTIYGAAGYTSAISEAIKRAKYRPDRRTGVLLAGALGAACLRGPFPPIGAVVPMATCLRRRVRRGFGLPDLLARQVARALDVPSLRALHAGYAPRQAGMSRAERAQNVKGRVRATTDVPSRVLLVDDVVTTGATASAAATELLCAGAEEVYVLALCVAAPDHPEPTNVLTAHDPRVTM